MNQKFIVSFGIFIFLTLFTIYLKENPEIRKRIYSPEMNQVKIEGPVKGPEINSFESGSTRLNLLEMAGGIVPSASMFYEGSRLDQLLVDDQAVDLGKR